MKKEESGIDQPDFFIKNRKINKIFLIDCNPANNIEHFRNTHLPSLHFHAHYKYSVSSNKMHDRKTYM